MKSCTINNLYLAYALYTISLGTCIVYSTLHSVLLYITDNLKYKYYTYKKCKVLKSGLKHS